MFSCTSNFIFNSSPTWCFASSRALYLNYFILASWAICRSSQSSVVQVVEGRQKIT
ncbi:hypothetical protein ES319_A05G320500v1 [Gossypium barbadense]|uniref:Uncharacterized protein n=2 Tax=Gossypium TaxID=3633 RepID=A0A5J5VX73_GOSBA|nr:hypothetical protein ES319_A05G320500v1 [Gossypium barbadense]TYH19243.1 hypothetical protein ES288_A05G337500v1 [Gossypium darwinii]